MAEPITNGTPAAVEDVEMKEEVAVDEPLNNIEQASDPTDPQPPPQTQPEAISEPLPATLPAPSSAAATPPVQSAANTRPGSMPPQPPARPEKPVAHGGPTRQYLNQNITPHLLEAMKHLAVYEPEKPLLWLSEFLRDRSKEIEG